MSELVGNQNVGFLMTWLIYLSCVMKNPAFCTCEKGTDQLHGKLAAVHRLCFRYIDSTIPLHVLSKSEI